jgi:FKBP-type peptidyl-prolyl cis-trans isomerase
MAGARAFLLGPLWAAQRSRWFVFAMAAIGEVTGLVLLVQGFTPPIEDVVPMPGRGLVLIILVRIALGLVGAYGSSTAERVADSRLTPHQALLIGIAILLFAYPLIVYRFTAPQPWGVLVNFPTFDGLDSGTAYLFDVTVDWMKRSWVDFFDAFTAGLRDSINGSKTQLSEEEIKTSIQAFGQKLMAKKKAEQDVIAEKNKTASQAFLDANAKKEGVKTTASGLQYRVITEGKGAKPKADDQVEVNYRGTLIDGTEFDSSYKRGAPVPFTVNQVIPGFSEGLQLMPVGSKYELVIPAEIAYGPAGTGPDGPIPPNSALVFEVELVKIDKAAKK